MVFSIRGSSHLFAQPYKFKMLIDSINIINLTIYNIDDRVLNRIGRSFTHAKINFYHIN